MTEARNDLVTRTDREGIAVLTFGASPDNALTRPMRAALAEALAAAMETPAIAGVVLTGHNGVFSSETGVGTADGLGQAPSLSDLCTLVATARRPVVAAVSGAADGPGLEIALAARARVAAPPTRLGWSGAALGLVPGGGATQRLPRLAGAAPALRVLADGRSLSAETARDAGMVDRVAEDAVTEACALVRELSAPDPSALDVATAGAGPVLNPAALLEEIARRRARLTGHEPPPVPEILRLLEAAALLPLDAGLEMERAAFADMLARADCAGLRHAARIEARPLVGAAGPRPVARIAVLGADAGAAPAARALANGLAVTLIDPDDALLAARRDVIAAALSRDGASPALAALEISSDLSLAPEIDLVIVAESGALAAEYLRLAGLTARPDAVIAALTAGDRDPAGLTGRPGDTVTAHWPMRPGTRRHAALSGGDVSALATVEQMARAFGRHPIRASWPPDRPEVVLRATLLRCLEGLLLAGSGPGVIDAELAAQGWAGGGPCRGLDTFGLDQAAALADRAAAAGWAPAPPGVVRTLAEAGLSGRAAGQGLYSWDEGQPKAISAALERALDQAGEAAPAGDEIVARVIAALAVAGLRLIESGAVPAASDVDLAGLHALGVPRAWGGPMQAADARGPLWLRATLRRLEAEDPALWTRPATLDRLVRDGRPLADLG